MEGSYSFITVEAERNPESLRKWLSVVEEGKARRKGAIQFSLKAKKHLSALGWRFAYVRKGTSREMRYKSPEGKWFSSLVTACGVCLEEEDDDSSQEQDVNQEAPVADVPKKKRVKVCDTDKNRSSRLAKNILNEQEKASDESSSDDEAELTPKPRFGKSQRTNCDVCCVCHHGGVDLLLCNGCPSAFHPACSGLRSIASDEQEWFFCSCCCCDICNERRTPGISMLLTCVQCRRRRHQNCREPPEPLLDLCRPWFCSAQCSRVFSALQKLQGTKIAVVGEEGLVWSLMGVPNDGEQQLDSAVKMLQLSFKPTPDRFSGRDLVEELMFSKDSDGVGRTFYTVSIERNNKPIVVVAVRVGKDVAEIPLLATLTRQSNDRRSRMCRVLMDELEKQMSGMGVRRLVLPALAEDVATWTKQFGFSVMESSESLELMKRGLFDFLGTVMCHKFLKEREEPSESSPTE